MVGYVWSIGIFVVCDVQYATPSRKRRSIAVCVIGLYSSLVQAHIYLLSEMSNGEFRLASDLPYEKWPDRKVVILFWRGMAL